MECEIIVSAESNETTIRHACVQYWEDLRIQSQMRMYASERLASIAIITTTILSTCNNSL